MVIVVVGLTRPDPGVPRATVTGATLLLGRPRPTIVVRVAVSIAGVGSPAERATTVALLLRPTCEIVVVRVVAARLSAPSPMECAVAIHTRPPCAVVVVMVLLASRTLRVPLAAAARLALR